MKEFQMIINSKRMATVAAAALAMCMAAGSAFAQDRGHGGHDRDGRDGHNRYEQRDRGHGNDRHDNRRGGRGWDRDDNRPGRHFDRPGHPHPHAEWRRGGRVPHEYRGRNYVVNDWRAYRLQQPPRGYQWVGVGGDYVLAAIATGLIAQIIVGNQ
jgi:Ni/Co efflux regulator RcnB